MRKILETERLLLRELTVTDAPFIVELLNTPSFLRFIGDRGVRTTEDAVRYIQDGPVSSYKQNGFGLWLVVLKEKGILVGMCGLIRRAALENVDIGFALLPAYEGKGIGYEAAAATLRYGLQDLDLQKIVAIVDPANVASVGLLRKLGMQPEGTVRMPGDTLDLSLFAAGLSSLELPVINALTKQFFQVFTNKNGVNPSVEKIYDMFIPNGIIIKNVGGKTEVFNLEQFVNPRLQMLTDGSLTDFEEMETKHETQVFGNIAHRFCHYSKSGTLNGTAFETTGAKSIQFIKTATGWKISALAWDDVV